MTQEKVVLDEDDIRRTLVRIAHEIVEKNADGDVALVGIHRRGAHLATRLHRLVCDLLDADVPRGDIDIAFYRDDLATRGAAAGPVVHASHLPFRLEDHTVVLADRGHRELPIRPDYVGKNLPTARSERVNVRVEEVDGRDEVTITTLQEALA